ncbi:DUF5666 domain-containing protein [Meiothermus rufus]|uniref:DUF5666 domain-containing protein n=1 Tax=Meiothermus rufus TaxID=604332 RepID=UPI00041C4A41|nr:DUF5666 domain-containing protein [Meiothermus rufus]
MRKRLAYVAGFLLALLAGCGYPPNPSAQEELNLSGVVAGSPGALLLGVQALDTAQATVEVDGEPADDSAIQPGVVLAGQGLRSQNRIHLSKATLHYAVKGPVDAVNSLEGFVDVMGVRAKVSAFTYLYRENPDGSYTSLTLADLQPGQYVHLAGLPQDDDSLVATRIEVKRQPKPSVSLRVHARDLNTTAQTFTYGLRTYTVQYQGVVPKGSLGEGSLVKVKGSLVGQTVVATALEVLSPTVTPPANPGNPIKMKLEGLLGSLDTASQTFTLMGYTVYYGTARVKGSLAEGAWAEVEGYLKPDGSLEAYEVEVKYPKGTKGYDGEVKGAISAITADTLTVGGTTFWVDAATIIEREHQAIPFGSLQVGDWVEVKFNTQMTNPSGQPYAVRIELKRASSNLEVKGTIQNFNALDRTFQMGGVTIRTHAQTRYEVGDRYVSAEVFWGTNRDGQRGEAKGSLEGEILTASKIEVK